MLAIFIASDWYYGVGKLYKQDGTPYATKRGAFRNHPCTQWAAANQYNLAWLIRHGYALCHEYNLRYNKVHTCLDVIEQAERILKSTIENINKGLVAYKNDKAGTIHAALGKVSFDESKLTENVTSFIDEIKKIKPSGLKGNFVNSVYLSSSMGFGLRVEI